MAGWSERELLLEQPIEQSIHLTKTTPEAPAIVKTDPYSILAFIEWCRAHKYHVPEIAGEYVQYLRVMQK